MNENALTSAALWSYGIAAVGFVAFVIRLALGWRSSPRARLLLAAILASALWAGSGLVAAYQPVRAAWLAAIAFDALRYGIWFLFLINLLRQGRDREVPVNTPSYPPRWVTALVIAGLIATLFLPGAQPIASESEAPYPKEAFGIHLGLAIFGLMLIEQLIRRTGPQTWWALKPLCLALAGVFAFDLFFFADAMLFGRLDPDIWIARGIANALVIPFIAVATARNTGWTIEMHLSRRAVFHSTAILVSGVFLLAIAVAGYYVRYFGGEWGRAFQIELSFAAALVGVLVLSSGRFRAQLRVFVSKHFFSYRYDYREEWLRFTRTLSTESALHGVQERSIKALADLVESPGGALWLKQESGFRPVARWNLSVVDVAEPADGSLPRFLERTGWVINLREYGSASERYPDLALPQWLASLSSAWLVVPLVSSLELVGFVVLATPLVTVEVNWEVLDLLKTASRQAASYLGEIRATEALLEARKFDAFNRMSAFVVHDLKNLVAQLSLMLRNAERHRDNPEFQRDMLTTVEHVVGRMNQLMLQLRTGTTPVEKPGLVDLESVVLRICKTKSGHRSGIALELAPRTTVIGHEERLDRVIGHLVQNALDATAENGDVTVRLGGGRSGVMLEVIDTGVGMTPEFVRDRLFKPFQTSKSAGMGIGVYESAQYLASLGGRILVDSTPGVGTHVRVVFPPGDACSAAPADTGVEA